MMGSDYMFKVGDVVVRGMSSFFMSEVSGKCKGLQR